MQGDVCSGTVSYTHTVGIVEPSQTQIHSTQHAAATNGPEFTVDTGRPAHAETSHPSGISAKITTQTRICIFMDRTKQMRKNSTCSLRNATLIMNT